VTVALTDGTYLETLPQLVVQAHELLRKAGMSRPPAGGTLRLASVPAVLVIALVAAIVLAGGRARASEPLQTRPSSPLHAGWQVGPEHPVSDPVYVSAAPSQSLPKIAFDGTNYLVVWQEDRGNQYGDVYASRVAPDGAVLDPHGIPIATARASELNPAVAFDGTNYPVTWTASSFPDGDIYGVRVSQSGEVLDPGGFPISTAPGLQDFSAFAFDGTNYLVVWTSGHYPADIYAARVTPAGTVLDPDGIPVSTAAGEQSPPAVAFDGENDLVAWEDGRNPTSDVYGARVTPTGTVLDPVGVAISSAAGCAMGSEALVRRHELPRRVAGRPERRRLHLRRLRRPREPSRLRAGRFGNPDLDGAELAAHAERGVRRDDVLRRLVGPAVG
jgi:hypothetical protein